MKLLNTVMDRLQLHQLWLLWGCALLLRVTYLALALTEIGFERLRTAATDSYHYNQIALYFLNGVTTAEPAILRSGPGYGLMLACIRTIFGESMIWPILINVFLGSLAPVMIYLLAHKLTHSRVVAMLAGLIACYSLTSISLSSQILTDQPFFTIFCAALVIFVHGLSNGQRRWFLLAGLLAGFATWVRTAGELTAYFFPIVALVATIPPSVGSRWKFVWRAAITSLVMLIMIFSWSARNYVTDSCFSFSTNGVLAARNYLVSLSVAQHTPGIEWSHQSRDWAAEDGDNELPLAESYRNAKSRVIQTTLDHPGWILATFWNLILENSSATNHILYHQVPSLQPFTLFIYTAVENWLGYLILILGVLGIVMLIIDRQCAAALLLGLIFTYFTLTIGFSFGQGSRLHYQAEMGWSILIAYLVVRIHQIIVSGIERLRRA